MMMVIELREDLAPHTPGRLAPRDLLGRVRHREADLAELGNDRLALHAAFLDRMRGHQRLRFSPLGHDLTILRRLAGVIPCDTIVIRMPILAVKLPNALDQRLSATAGRRDVSRSRLVREPIEMSLSIAGSKNARGSCLNLVRDLVGVHRGPRGLLHDRSTSMAMAGDAYAR